MDDFANLEFAKTEYDAISQTINDYLTSIDENLNFDHSNNALMHSESSNSYGENFDNELILNFDLNLLSEDGELNCEQNISTPSQDNLENSHLNKLHDYKEILEKIKGLSGDFKGLSGDFKGLSGDFKGLSGDFKRYYANYKSLNGGFNSYNGEFIGLSKFKIKKFEGDKLLEYVRLKRTLKEWRQGINKTIKMYFKTILNQMSNINPDHNLYQPTRCGIEFIIECLSLLSRQFYFKPYYFLYSKETIENYVNCKVQLKNIMNFIPLSELLEEITINMYNMINLEGEANKNLRRISIIAKLRIRSLKKKHVKICGMVDKINLMMEQQEKIQNN